MGICRCFSRRGTKYKQKKLWAKTQNIYIKGPKARRGQVPSLPFWDGHVKGGDKIMTPFGKNIL
jgi:hypothetical protein